MIEKLKEIWWELRAWHDEMQWQNSKERQELAVTRISQLRDFTSGKSTFNPYAELMLDSQYD